MTDPQTLDQLRDWHARNDGWEFNAVAFSKWSKVDNSCKPRDDHPIPPTIDAANDSFPPGWTWVRDWPCVFAYKVGSSFEDFNVEINVTVPNGSQPSPDIRATVNARAYELNLTAYAIAKATNGQVSEDAVRNFLAGRSSLTVAKLQALLPVLGLELVPIDLAPGKRANEGKVGSSAKDRHIAG